MAVDAQRVKRFRDRWREVEAIEIEEQRTASVALRWQQLNAIFRLAVGLGLILAESDEQEQVVRRRWTKLKEIWLNRQEEMTNAQ
jgi:hypothetical protein